MEIRQLSPFISVSPQIAAVDLAILASRGFRTNFLKEKLMPTIYFELMPYAPTPHEAAPSCHNEATELP